jgi:hypothetical protein
VCCSSGNGGGCGGYGGGCGGYGGGCGYSNQSYTACGQSGSSSSCNSGSGYQNGCYSSGSGNQGGYCYQSSSCGSASSGVACTTSSSCTSETVYGSASASINVQTAGSSTITCGGTAPTGCLENLYGQSNELEFCYSPSDCVSQAALSSGLCSVSGHNGCSSAFIQVSDCSNPNSPTAQVCFQGTVATGQNFYCDAQTDLNNLPTASNCDYFGASNGCLYIDIYASQADFDNNCAPVQQLCYNASGADQNHIGDQCGSVKLTGYVGTSGHGYVC